MKKIALPIVLATATLSYVVPAHANNEVARWEQQARNTAKSRLPNR